MDNTYVDIQEELDREELIKWSDTIQDFTKYCSEKSVQLNGSNFRYMCTIGLYVEYPNILQILSGKYPDKEGLYCESELLKIYAKKSHVGGLYYGDNYMPMAHPFFRRDYGTLNNFAPRFVEKFWELNLTKIDKFIALDANRVRINVDDSMYKEFDTWYGASFSRNIAQIDNGPVVLAPPFDITDFYDDFFGNILKLDLIWSENNGLKTFQAEELKKESVTIKFDGKTYHPVRYIHAQYDLKGQEFCHLDGAIHLYLPDEFELRKCSDLNYNQKNDKQLKSRSIKMFKINGPITVDIWSELVCQFFTGDPQFYEYVAGHYPDYISNIIKAIRLSAQK